MFEPVKIAPSILSADFMNLSRDIDMCERAGADMIHVDVMDGHFVPNITMGVPIVKQLAPFTNLQIDAHLMVSNPLDQIPWFASAGADSITIHVETLSDDDLLRAIEMIRDAGSKVGIAIKPATPVARITSIIQDVDMVVVMSVNPGFSGQRYIAGSEKKVSDVVTLATNANVSPLIEVDGGINATTACLASAAGGDVLVCGNSFFCAADAIEALCELRQAADDAQRSTLENMQ